MKFGEVEFHEYRSFENLPFEMKMIDTNSHFKI